MRPNVGFAYREEQFRSLSGMQRHVIRCFVNVDSKHGNAGSTRRADHTHRQSREQRATRALPYCSKSNDMSHSRWPPRLPIMHQVRIVLKNSHNAKEFLVSGNLLETTPQRGSGARHSPMLQTLSRCILAFSFSFHLREFSSIKN